ncbi:putative chromosome-partitioning protein ParB [Limihaloglobus sulfuriphilus]|uniref:Putative chromosome-partitioning protein ParB n=1 Tax=Limihaloglobus sulfuriphilus TaxID=1851148 RepID=A0A1R7T612_9BACT|nr:ParB/RepB/Spo0J family partition protein [Limihaloglobus sulfuriphilus]AQQ72126.1 putative chromosome-partitioning protein ParB [Limihaloglobus sulfuriphilus]
MAKEKKTTVKKKTAAKKKPAAKAKQPAPAKKPRPKQKHLGRGLQSLLGTVNAPAPAQTQQIPLSQPAPAVEKSVQSEAAESISMVPIDKIQPNPYQPRRVWNEEELSELVESIKVNGLLQPIIVRRKDTEYQLIAGERRWRAAKIAEMTEIKAIIRQATEEQMHEIALVENIHRSNLNCIERAQAYKDYIDQFHMTQTEAAEKLGENRATLANHVRLLELPSTVKEMLSDGSLSMGHARAILALPGNELRNRLANRAFADRLSVREVERVVKKMLSGQDNTEKQSKPAKAPAILDLEKRLASLLQTKVQIKTTGAGKKGRILIDYYSLDEFDRIAEKLGLHHFHQ